MHPFFSQLNVFLESTISPISNLLDTHADLLKKSFQQLVELNGLRIRIPTEYGGLGFERKDWIEYTSEIAQYSGALLFVQAQHQYAVTRLKRLLPDSRVAETLRMLAEDNQGTGIGFANNKNILTVEHCQNGFLISGDLKWVTGFEFFSRVLISFDKDGVDYYCFIPFKAIDNSIILSSILEPIVFSATNTVSISLNNYFVSLNDIISSSPSTEKIPFEHPAIYSFSGAAKALLKIAAHEKYHTNPLAKKRLNFLWDEWKLYHEKVIQFDGLDPMRLRASGLDLVEKCLSFTKLVCGAQGILSTHPITRISREIWQYSIAGYSESQLEAYLER